LRAVNTRDPLAAPAAAPLRILMVEDDPNDAELIQAYLEDATRAGAQVRHVRTLAEALERAADAQVTLLDLDLPDSAGLATLERMRAVTAGPLIVVSGNGHPALVEEALRRRAYDVIPKHQLDAATLRRVLRLAAQHEEASRAQRAAEGRFRALVETSSEALVLLDATGRVEYASAAMRRILGFDSSEALGRFGLEFVQPEDRALVQGAFGELRERPGAQSTMRVRFRHKDGGARVLESTLFNRLHEPDVAAVVCSYRDLTESETQRARFTATFETSPVGLAHVDLEGRILIANQRLCDMLGYAREELIGRRVRELSHPEDTEVTAEQVAQLRAGELPQFTARKRYLRKDGGLVWIQLSVSLEYDAAGLPSCEIAAFEDITEMERAKLRGGRLARMYAALSATNEATLKATDASALYRRVCELLVEHAGLKLAAVRLVDPTTHWLETVAHAGEPSSYLAGARIRVDDHRPDQQGPTMRTVVEGRTVVSNDYLAEPALARWHASARAAGIAAMTGVPLRRAGKPIGLLALYAAETGWFDPELVALAERMAENLSFALDNLDREAARRESEARFRALTEMSSDFYWETDERHRFRLRGSGTRPASQSTFGQDAWLGKARWELPYLSPDEAGWAAHRATLDVHQPFRDFVFSRPCPEVGERFIMVSGDPVFDASGRFSGYRGIGSDITQQRVAQQVLELEHAVAQYLATAESETDGIQGIMRTVCARLGWEQGRFWRVDDAAGVLKFGAHWGSENTDAMREVTFRPGEGLAGAVWRSGEPLWVADAEADARTSASAQAAAPLRAAFLFPVLAEGRTLGVFTFASDRIRPPNERLLKAVRVIGGQIGLFLQRRRSEAALRESEARFRSLSELSSDYFWETDAEHRFTVRGVGSQPSAQATFPQGVRGKRRWELPYLSPGREAWMAHKATLDAHLPFRDFELSRPTPDGGERHFSISGEPMFDERGAFVGYRGVGRDVTERRMAQRILELEHAVAQHLAAAESESEGLQGVLRAICSMFGWEQGRFWRAADQAGVLRLGAYWSEKNQSSEPPAALREMSFGPGEGIAGHVWQTGQPHWAPDAMADPRNDARFLAQAPLRAVFVFPVRAEGRVLGVLTFGSDEIRAPNDRLLKAVRVIGDHIGGFLQRKRGEEAQRRFRAGMDASADMILLIDPRQMRYVDVNETVCRTLGYSRDEMLAMGPQDLLPIPREELQAVYEEFIADPGSIYGVVDSAYRCKDGSLLPFESTRRLLDTRDGPLIVAISRDTRARKQAERALRESEARFRSLAELSSDWYWEQDAELRFTGFSGGQGDEKWGGDQSASLGRRRWEIAGLSPLSCTWQEHRALLAARQPFRGFEYMRVLEDGSLRYVSANGEPVYDADGRFAGYRGTATDITERKQAERRLRLEHDVARLLADARDEHAGLTGAMRALCEAEGWACGRYFEVDERANLLRLRGSWGGEDPEVRRFLEASRALEYPPGIGVRGHVWQSGEPLWVADLQADARVTPQGRAMMGEFRAALVFPVKASGRVIGVISISSRRMREPDDRLLRMVRTLGDQIGQFISRRRAEGALRESEARFRSLTELSSDWYWEQDAELRFISTGGQDRKRGGITAAQHDGLRRWELPGTEPLEGDWEAHKALLAARRPFRDCMLRRTGNDGAVHYVSVSGEPVFNDDGSFRGYRGIAKDVTASFEAVGAMRRFRAALDISVDAIYLVDIDAMRIVDLNESGWRNLGYAREDLLGQPPSILFSDVRDDKLRSQYERMLARGEDEQPYQTRHRRKDGSLVPVEVTRRTLVTPEGRYVIGIARDLTDRLRDEERLRDSHARFEIVSRATNDVVWDWNLVTDEIWWNENFQVLFGYEPGEVGSHIDSWTSRIHLEDLARVKAEITTTIERGDKSWAGEYRFRRKDGSYADVYDRGLLIHDDQGRAVRMIGAMMDISERKRAESRTRAHAQRQEAAAAFGQFALGRRNPEELYAAAAQALRTAGVDASVALEILGDGGEYVIRAAQGEGPHAVVGQRGKLSADSVWPDIRREGSSRIAGRAYLSARPAELPWGAWVRTMGSAVYSPVREGERPVGMLCVYAAREHAFGAEDVRFVDSLSHVLSTALQRHKAEQRLAHLAQFDALTGLPNRSLLQDRLDQTIVQSRRKRWHAGVLFVDLDHFKLVNDSLGHHLGDALIREVGQRLLSSVRPGDTVGRISGDEFAVVLADLARPDDAALVAQKVLDALAQPFDLAGNEAYVTASIGIAAFPEDGDDAETLIKNADMAMYRAKESARNSYCFFTAEMNQRTVAKVQLSADLRRAIERGEFTLHFQPKVALDTGELRGLEALLRWNHPTRGMVSPAEFVPALEDSGLILPVGEWVIAEACAQVRQWELAGIKPVPIAVNLSAKQFMRRDLDRTITHTLAAAGVPPRLLELEITESCLMHNPEEAIRVLNALREAGLKISVDDFGTGYSSLAYLARFPLSALKIDRAFVRNVHSDANSSAIVRAVIDMANNLELQVVAEGVETEEQAEFLRSHGCHQAQGYLYSRPVPAEQLVPRLRAAA
jgi:diguanylate cyclase (GGDEF)-like protein/PAS domain S-box-containing protein